MTITANQNDKALEIALEGRLDTMTAPELEAELKLEDNRERQTAEYGDFLFSLINAGRLYHLNPDNALEHTNQKFIRRFNHVELRAREMGVELKDMTLAQMDELWNEAKAME